jgi:hypothetical protein
MDTSALPVLWRLRQQLSHFGQFLLPGLHGPSRTRVLAVAAFTGAWGVLTGFVLFICISQSIDSASGNKGLWTFGGSLLAAVTVASIVEALREVAFGQHGKQAEHRPRRTFAAVLSSVVLLILFELCVTAYEEVSKAGLESAHTLASIAERVTGREPPFALLYFSQNIQKPEELIDAIEAASGGTAHTPLKRMAEMLTTQERWQLFRHAELPPVIWFGQASAEMRQSGNAGLFGTVLAPKTVAPASAVTPVILVSTSGKMDEGCGIALAINPESFNRNSVLESAVMTIQDMESGERERLKYPEKKPEARADLLCEILNRIVLDPAFYEEGYFSQSHLPEAISVSLAKERHLHDQLALLAEEGNSPKGMTKMLTLKRQRLSAQSQALLNQSLLAAILPQHFTAPPPVDRQRWLDILALALAWIVSGAVLTAGIAMVVFDTDAIPGSPERRRNIMRSVARGVVIACVIAPLAVATYIITARLVNIIVDLALDRGLIGKWIWNQFNSPSALTGIPVAPVMLLYRLGHAFAFSWIFVILILGVLLRFRKSWFARVPLIWLGLGLIVLATHPFWTSEFLLALLLTAIVWIAPAIILGAAAPYLKPGAVLPAVWGPLGIAAGLVLAVVTVWRLDDWWWLALPALLLIFAGVLIRARWSLEEYWPILALVVCLMIAGSTALLQQATFRGVLGRVHSLSDRIKPGGLEMIGGMAHMDRLLKSMNFSRPGAIVPDGKGGWTVTRYESPLTVRLAEEAEIEALNDAQTTRLLELILVSALGFWSLIGLLAAWGIRDAEHEKQA